ncbi:MAG: efflux RND transporter permease subunit [Cyanobacteriota/Melainabacteria group bacterium]
MEEVKKAIPYIRDLLPKDVKVSFEFDQSIYVTEAVKGVLFEGGIGAVLTGLMVLLFLGDALRHHDRTNYSGSLSCQLSYFSGWQDRVSIS